MNATPVRSPSGFPSGILKMHTFRDEAEMKAWAQKHKVAMIWFYVQQLGGTILAAIKPEPRERWDEIGEAMDLEFRK